MGRKSLKYYINGAFHKFGRWVIPKYKRNKVTLFRYTSALGDALFLTTLAREVKKRNPDAFVHVITGIPVVFENNPYVNKVTFHESTSVEGLGRHLISYEKKFPWTKHLLNHCADCVDINNEIELRTYIYPTEKDFQWAQSIIEKRESAPILVNRIAGPRTDKKNWPDPYWNTLINELVKTNYVIEIGTHSNHPVVINDKNYLNLVGKTTIHQTAALMSEAQLIICPITGLLHMASAFDLPTLCILGGSEPSYATKYKHTHYIENRPPCADCYEKGPCNFQFVCLEEIKPEQVLKRVQELIST